MLQKQKKFNILENMKVGYLKKLFNIFSRCFNDLMKPLKINIFRGLS